MPSPSLNADQGRNLDPCLLNRMGELHDCKTALAGSCLCDLFRVCRCVRNTHRSNSDSRSLQRVSKCGDRRGFTRTHPIKEQFGLAIEQLKYLPFQASVAKRHAREAISIEHLPLRYIKLGVFGFGCLSRGSRHVNLPMALFIGREFGSIGIKSR